MLKVHLSLHKSNSIYLYVKVRKDLDSDVSAYILNGFETVNDMIGLAIWYVPNFLQKHFFLRKRK